MEAKRGPAPQGKRRDGASEDAAIRKDRKLEGRLRHPAHHSPLRDRRARRLLNNTGADARPLQTKMARVLLECKVAARDSFQPLFSPRLDAGMRASL